MQITIQNDQIEYIDGKMAARIPNEAFYLYLNPYDIIERGTDHIRAEISEGTVYTIGPKDSTLPRVKISGDKLARRYTENVEGQPGRSAGELSADSTKIIISKSIVERIEEDGMIVSRIPGTKKYLYLNPEAVLEEGDKALLAEIKSGERYTMGDINPEKSATRVRGELIQGYYRYYEAYDPQLKDTMVLDQTQQQSQSAAAQKQQTKVADQPRESSQPVSQAEQKQDQAQTAQQQSTINVKYSREQFKQLKLGQKHHLDIAKYWDIHLSAEQMKQLRLMQEAGVKIDELGYNHPGVSAGMLNELRQCHRAGYSLEGIRWQMMNEGQLKEIRLGMEQRLDISQYSFPAYSAEQMKQLRLGLKNGLNITPYRNPHFTVQQMYSLRCSQIFEQIKLKLKQLFDSAKQFLQQGSLSRIHMAVMDKVAQGLDKTVEALSQKEMVQGPFHNQEVPEISLDDRIRETVQDIKEMLVAQELVPETVLEDKALSERLDTRIREGLDSLMQPENIQNTENQEQIVSGLADEVLQETGAVLPKPDMQAEQIEKAKINEAEQSQSEQKEHSGKSQVTDEEWEKLSDKEKMESLALEEEYYVAETERMLMEMQETGMALVR